MAVNQNQVVNNADSDNNISDANECELSNVVNDTVDNKVQNECFTQSNMEEVNDTFARPAQTAFKKPVVLIGPRKDKFRKLHTILNVNSKSDKTTADVCSAENVDSQSNDTSTSEETSKFDNDKPDALSGDLQKDKQIPLPYNEPSWSGLPDNVYKIEVLKSGVILETIDLTKKNFHVFGRLPLCDVPLAHPTISRYHAILQYRSTEDENNAKGMYLYDLGSTHGTFWNGNRIRPNVYVRLRGSHMIRFGCSQRKFILQAPHDDEKECELSVTELKERRKLELEERERKEKEFRLEVEAMEKLRQEREESEGINWGMGEDADEETDLTENPYAFSNNEELFLDDPKKTLRGWFEREGYELQYQTEEKGIGQFLCWVELPIDNATGRTVKAEALVKGKKKESVIQCALEACRILDRHGLLRQANHEGRKRKARNWEEEDYYDSDEDNFLDRTGVIEKKREQRMRTAGKLNTAVETYSSLVNKHKEIVKEISNIKDRLQRAQRIKKTKVTENESEDALDAFMSNLNLPVLNKSDISKLKLKLQELCNEEERLISLVNIAKPVNLPPLTLRTSMDKVDKKDKDSEKVGHKKKCKGMAVKSETKTSNDLIILSTTINERKKFDNIDNNEANEISDCNKEIVNRKLIESHESELTTRKDKCNTIVQMEVQTTVERHVEEQSTIVLDEDLTSIKSKKAVIEETMQSKLQPQETDKKEVVKKKK